MRKFLLAMMSAALFALPAAAQDPSPAPVTPAVVQSGLGTPLPSVTAVAPFDATPAAIPATLPAEDARLASCAAPSLPGFIPYFVTTTPNMADLLTGSSAFTPAQVASLNCLDSSEVVPRGVTVWLPQDALAVLDVPPPAQGSALAGEPLVSSLTLSPSQGIQNAGGATAAWQSESSYVRLNLCPVDNEVLVEDRCVQLANGAAFPPAGSLALDHFWRGGDYAVQVIPYDGQGAAGEYGSASFAVACSHESLAFTRDANGLCPENPPQAVGGAYQPFERGAMIWFSDTRQILVLTSDGRARYFEDLFQEGMSNPAAAAPEGLLTPVRGFGRIWEALGGAEGSGLGWALALETGMDILRQPAGRNSFSTYIQLPNAPGGAIYYTVTQIPGQESGYFAVERG